MIRHLFDHHHPAWVGVTVGALVVAAMWLSWLFIPALWTFQPVGHRHGGRIEYEILVVVLIVLIGLFGVYVWARSHAIPLWPSWPVCSC